jgi:integrase
VSGRHAPRGASAAIEPPLTSPSRPALAWATKQRPQLAAYNAADLVDPKPAYRPPEKRPLAGSDHARLLAEAEARSSPYVGAWALLVYCGLRPSEVRGLKWTDIATDWSAVTAERARSSPTGKDGAHASKSRRAKRSVPLPETAAAILRRHRERQRFRAAAAAHWHEMGLVLANDEGEPPNYRTVTRMFKTMCKHAGLPTETTIYSLRHGYATELLAAGVPLHEVSWLLGHASVTLTVDTYSHRVTHRDAGARAAIERAIGAKPDRAESGGSERAADPVTG